MRKVVRILSAAVIVFSFSVLNAEELKFESGSWNSIIDLARKSDKYIFLDAYTDWCGWCKVMDKETFTDKETIDLINRHFIPVKYEMETGVGMTLAMKYRVRSFPSQLFFDKEGRLIYASSGYQPPKKFMETLNKVLDKNNHWDLKGITPVLEPDFPDLYKAAFEKNGSEKKRFPTIEEVSAFLGSRKDLFDEVSWSVMSVFQTNEEYDRLFLDNYEKYRQLYGGESTNRKLYSIVYGKFDEAVKEKSETAMNDVFGMIDRYDKDRAKENKDFYRIMFYENTENWEKFASEIDERIRNGKLSDDNINDYSWKIYENCNDEKFVKKAAEWIKPVIERNPNYMNLDTYAALLYKSQNYEEAKRYAEKAIEFGKKSGDNVNGTEKLLQKIKLELK